MPSKHMQAWVKRLLDGEEGSTIVAEMRQRYSTDCSLMTRISAARRLYMTSAPSGKQTNRNPTLSASVRELEREAEKLGSAHPCSKMIRLFTEADLRTMYGEWRRRPHLQPGCVHTGPVQTIFEKMRVLPSNMDSFRAPTVTLQECIAENEEARLRKSETMSVVEDADKILAKAVAILREPESRTLSEVIVSLCIVSGRRLGEIASPRSRFWPMTGDGGDGGDGGDERLAHELAPRRLHLTGGRVQAAPAGKDGKSAVYYAHGVMFEGQLKQNRLLPLPPYAIPLVGATAAQFLAGIANLRSRQDDDLSKRTQSEISSLYQSNARKYIKAEIPAFRKQHEARAFYAACVYKAFDWKRLSEPRVVMYVLGHQNMNFFVNYKSVQIGKFSASYGEFPVNITSRKEQAGRMSLQERKRAGV